MKTYEMTFQGRVDYTVRVEAIDPSDALVKARELRDEVNLKSEIYVNGWFDDEFEDEVEEIDLVAEERMNAKMEYLLAKEEELGEEEFWKNRNDLIEEYDAMNKEERVI